MAKPIILFLGVFLGFLDCQCVKSSPTSSLIEDFQGTVYSGNYEQPLAKPKPVLQQASIEDTWDLISYPEPKTESVEPRTLQVKNLQQKSFSPRRPSTVKAIWNKAKGEPADNALYLGMWSFHFDGEGEFSSKVLGDEGDDREDNNLIGLQYKGLFAGTFINSQNDQTVLLALSRKVIDKNLFNTKTKFQAGYKAGLIYGYGDRYPNVGGVSPVAIATAGLSYKIFGAELNWIPGTPVVGLSTRINIDPITDYVFDSWGGNKLHDDRRIQSPW